MIHYWGTKAILERVGLSPGNFKRFPELRERYGFPCFRKKRPGTKVLVYYASEAMISQWELAAAKNDIEEVRGEVASGMDRRSARPAARKRMQELREERRRICMTPQPVVLNH